MERARPFFRLLAMFSLALAALGMLFLLSASLADHHFQRDAQRAIRHVFTQGGGATGGVEHIVTCQLSSEKGERPAECDPLAIKGPNSFRNGRCTNTVPRSILGNEWECIAKFKDGSTVDAEVSVGLGSRTVKLFLPVRDPGV